ncbi:MAG: hypothetical protein FWE22_07425 [Firmicutes bacterium]|nr:hypothetical protein [Bacillota bacterium]
MSFEKKELKKKYKEFFEIVKLHIDDWDCIGLLSSHCPKNEYDIETAEIVPNCMENKLCGRIN